MLKCYITDRLTLPPGASLMDVIEKASYSEEPRSSGSGREEPDWIQIREKDLSAREFLALVTAALELRGPKILVNTRMDVALAAGAAGCHLPANSPPPSLWRKITPVAFLIGMSCHTVEEVRTAESEGADYVFFGPVFPPRSKASPLPARGLELLARAAGSVRIPVLALGGITETNMDDCVKAGAAGIAAISLFQSPPVLDRGARDT